MKQVSLFLCACASVLLFASCVSSPTSKKNPEMMGDIDAFLVDSLTAGQMKLFVQETEQKKLELTLFPKSGELRFEFFSSPNKQEIFLDRAGRDALSSAIEAYKKDFESKSLLKDSNKTVSVYGKPSVMYKWGVLTYNAEARVDVSLGYRFVGDSPYFTIVVPSVKNRLYETGDSKVKESAMTELYFTNAQLSEIAQFLDQKALEAAVQAKLDENPSAKADTY